MSLSRKHFRELADLMAEVTAYSMKKGTTKKDVVNRLENKMYGFCRNNNYRFDSNKFNDWVDNKVKENEWLYRD